MLAIVAAATILVLLVAILSNRVSPLVALILIPIVGALAAGFTTEIPGFILGGIGKIAPVAGMFVFAILFFGIMMDTGLLAPAVGFILRSVGMRPSRITVGTALLALIIHLDGSGAVCFLVTIPAIRPLYDALDMDRRVLACTASLAAGVNFLPWTGPTLRAAASLKLSTMEIVAPLIVAQLAGLAFVFLVAWWLGIREERRLGLTGPGTADQSQLQPCLPELSADALALRRPRLFWVNAAITLAVVTAMVLGWAEPVVVFMVGTALALVVNYPRPETQRALMAAHAPAAMLMVGVLLAAGAFSGILNGSGMIKALAGTTAGHMPPGLGPHIPLVVALVGMPLTLMFDADSYYFGILPVLAEVGQHFGVPPLQVAQASLLGMGTTGFPVSPLTPATFLVAGLSGVELGAHQRFSIPWLYGASLVMTAAALVLGVIPL
jgi:CitMHS family citrate-Mg2+:H+ or citrate-Ca2+:H+ symporter